jgi:hypothetical protein
MTFYENFLTKDDLIIILLLMMITIMSVGYIGPVLSARIIKFIISKKKTPKPIRDCHNLIWDEMILVTDEEIQDYYSETEITMDQKAPEIRMNRERILEKDDRVLTDASTHLFIVKLRMKFGNDWYMGTGYIIKDGVIYTAGHNLWDPDQQIKANDIEIYLGYHMKGSKLLYFDRLKAKKIGIHRN